MEKQDAVTKKQAQRYHFEYREINYYKSEIENLFEDLNKWNKEKKSIYVMVENKEKAKKLNVPELNSFVELIESDLEAVKNAIIYEYSNGVTEGFNNKTKVIKRQMYGRCGFDLLRLKILV